MKKLIGMRWPRVAALAVVAGASTAPAQSTSLTIYSGRDARARQADHGSRSRSETGHRAERPLRVVARRSPRRSSRRAANSPADVYWSQEPGTLGLVAARGAARRASRRRPSGGARRDSRRRSRRWVGTSGRSRVLVYNTQALPRPSSSRRRSGGSRTRRWKGKIGIAPDERVVPGVPRRDDPPARREPRANVAARPAGERRQASIPNNTAVVQAVGRGDVQVGPREPLLPLHPPRRGPEPAGAQPLVPGGRPGHARSRRRRRHRVGVREGRGTRSGS